MAKRPSLATFSAEQASAPVAVAPVTPATTKRDERVKCTIYLDEHTWRALRKIAAANDVKLHDLFLDGIDHVLNRHGQPVTTRR